MEAVGPEPGIAVKTTDIFTIIIACLTTDAILCCGRKSKSFSMSHPLLILSYGAPQRHEDVLPFLHNLFAGKNVPEQRIADAVQKYERFAEKTGRYSPLNEECRNLVEGIRQIDSGRPIYWGNLFWHPLLTDTVAKMRQDGIEQAVCFATSAFDSPAGNQRYADALMKAMDANLPLIIEKVPLPFAEPLFIESQADRLLEIPFANMPAPYLLFSAHSIPLADAARSHYVEQLQFSCRAVIERLGIDIPWELLYQSRSGLPTNWLGPDIKERIGQLATQKRYQSIIVSPIGFFCENMETQYDLDIEVSECCATLGLSYHRAQAVGALPKICQMIAASLNEK